MMSDKNIAELTDELVSKLKKINWKNTPYRGLVRKLGIELGYEPKYAYQYAYARVFKTRDYTAAQRLIDMIDEIKQSIKTTIESLDKVTGSSENESNPQL